MKLPSFLPTLKKLTFVEDSSWQHYQQPFASSLEVIRCLIESHPSIVNFQLEFVTSLSEELLPSLTLFAANLTSLAFGRCELQVVPGLLPLCTSLLKLFLWSSSSDIQQLSFLLFSSRLTELSLKLDGLNECPLWSSSFFENGILKKLQLKRLCIYTHIKKSDNPEMSQFIEHYETRGTEVYLGRG